MKHLINWVVGIVSVVLTVVLGRALGLHLVWTPEWHIVVFVPLLALVNAIVRPLVKLLAMPITCLTFGLFNLVINALMFWLAAYYNGAKHLDFWTALFGTVCVSVISTVLSGIVGKATKSRDDDYDR